MPDFEFTSPEGKKYVITGPEGATKEQAFGILQGQLGGQQPPAQAATSQEPAGFGYQQQIAQGMPIVGPLMNKASAAIGAAIQPLMGQGGDKSFGERYSGNLQSQEAQDAAFAASHPIGSTAANLVGGGLVLGPVAKTAAGAKLLGMSGNLAERVGFGGIGGAGIGASDAALRGESPTTGAMIGGGLAAGVPLVGATGSAMGHALKRFVEPFTQGGQESRVGQILSRNAATGNVIPVPNPLAGSELTLAQSTKNPGLSQLERSVRNLSVDTGVPQQFVDRDTQNLANRLRSYGDIAGDQPTLDAAIAARGAERQQNMAQVWGNKTDTDASAVISSIDSRIKAQTGNSAVISPLQSVKDELLLDNPLADRIKQARSLINAGLQTSGAQTSQKLQQARQLLTAANTGKIEEADLIKGLNDLAKTQKTVGPLDNALDIIKQGNKKIQSDPELLWNTRKKIDDLLDPRSNNYAGKQATRQLMGVRETLDDAIEKGAAGYKSAQADYAARSGPINTMQLLQDEKIAPVGMGGDVQLSRLDSLIRSIESDKAKPGISKYTSVTDDQLNQLKAIREDARLGGVGGPALGKAIGANTAQNLQQNILGGGTLENFLRSQIKQSAAGAVLGAGAGYATGENPAVGGLAGLLAGHALAGRYSKADQAMLQKLAEKLLNPQSGAAAINNQALAQALRRNPVGLKALLNLPNTTPGIAGYGAFNRYPALTAPASNQSP